MSAFILDIAQRMGLLGGATAFGALVLTYLLWPRAANWSNSQATNGVLPAPPAVRLPTQITGTGAR